MCQRRKEFDGLRFLLALCVMLWHSRVYIEQIFPSRIYVFRGEIANVVFFMLSGFFITFNKKLSINSIYDYLKFIFNKIRKIYPLYFLTLIYTSVILDKQNYSKNLNLFLCHMFLVQSWPVHNNAAGEYNGPMWFLSCLFFCWIITPFIIRSVRKKWFYLFVIVLTVVFIIESFLEIDCDGIWKLWPIVAYLIGMIIGDINKVFCIEKIKYIQCIFSITLLLFGLIAEIACIIQCQYGFMYLSIIIFSMTLIVHVLLMEESILSKILKSKILSIGGACTMNIFVIHAPIMYTMNKIDVIKNKPYLWLMLVFFITLSVSVVLNNVEYRVACHKWKTMI